MRRICRFPCSTMCYLSHFTESPTISGFRRKIKMFKVGAIRRIIIRSSFVRNAWRASALETEKNIYLFAICLQKPNSLASNRCRYSVSEFFDLFFFFFCSSTVHFVSRFTESPQVYRKPQVPVLSKWQLDKFH